ncbi:hypothetical protein A0H81_11370 [Grifola frondosa]|uniref:Uncharacterized protein n=1 Tax=Grifola frondosa TaxID=5627 RepID=A0A1C7LW98_GRIFR|nr:hypothetical protein A0H81_11370 [Grifola frondosa]
MPGEDLSISRSCESTSSSAATTADLFKLEKFPDARHAPPYAILSHVWREEEVLFHHVQHLENAKKLLGFYKILGCCAKAMQDGYEWVWIDTCCIDKTSSSELSEAINSMYAWYNKSQVCYAYLDDMPRDVDPHPEESPFRTSKWFTRGWTLQELIAPTEVVLLAQEWSDIGTRSELADTIHEITRVDRKLLMGLPVHVSVAQRMAWAAPRSTTREEDRAYSLMGLFGISMPTIYGEGRQAFIRLQYEIMRRTTDHSIFAWDDRIGSGQGLLALDPSSFAFLASDGPIDAISYEDYARMFVIERAVPEHSLTNHGIRIRLPMRPHEYIEGAYVAALACCTRNEGETLVCYLGLRPVEGAVNRYTKMPPTFGKYVAEEARKYETREVYLEHDDPLASGQMDIRKNPATFARVFLFDTSHFRDHGLDIVALSPGRMWRTESGDRLRLLADGWDRSRLCGTAILREQRTGLRVAVILGLDDKREHRPRVCSELIMDLLVEDDAECWSYPSSDEIARRINHSYQNSAIIHRYFFPLREPAKQFFQCSKHLGTGHVHMTIDITPHPPPPADGSTLGWQQVNIIELYVEPDPYLMGPELEHFLTYLLHFLLQNDMSMLDRSAC